MAESLDKDNTMNEPLDQETYIKERQAYDEAELEVSGRYDQWILTLSGGALGLSITFIEKIAKNPTTDSLIWLKISWGCLVLSLLTALLSLVTSQSALRENRKELELAHSENRAPRHIFPRWFTYITNGLNWGSLFLFIFGVIFLCVFSFKNIDQNMADGGNNYGKATSQTINKTASAERDRGRMRPIPATSTEAEGGAGLRSTSTPKRQEIKNFNIDIDPKNNQDAKSTRAK